MKVALVGSGETWRDAPFDDQEWQIWCYVLGLDLPRITLSLSVPYSYRLSAGRQGKFPSEQILADFGACWFPSELCWLFPFALLAGAKEVGVYGELLTDEHRLAVWHWMTVCEQLRVPVLVSKGSTLLADPYIFGISQ